MLAYYYGFMEKSNDAALFYGTTATGALTVNNGVSIPCKLLGLGRAGANTFIMSYPLK